MRFRGDLEEALGTPPPVVSDVHPIFAAIEPSAAHFRGMFVSMLLHHPYGTRAHFR